MLFYVKFNIIIIIIIIMVTTLLFLSLLFVFMDYNKKLTVFSCLLVFLRITYIIDQYPIFLCRSQCKH